MLLVFYIYLVHCAVTFFSSSVFLLLEKNKEKTQVILEDQFVEYDTIIWKPGLLLSPYWTLSNINYACLWRWFLSLVVHILTRVDPVLYLKEEGSLLFWMEGGRGGGHICTWAILVSYICPHLQVGCFTLL